MSKLDPVQTQLLKEIGAYLMQVREDQSKSLEAIASTTFVPLRLLKAIEAGQVDILPEPVFVRGFIRRYAEALGLDGLAIAKQFPLNPTPLPEPSAPKPPPVQTTPPPKPAPSTPSKLPVDSGRSFPVLPVAVGVLALGGVIFGLSQLSNRDPSPVSSSPEPSVAVAPPSPEAPSPAASPTPPSPAATPAAASPTPRSDAPVQADVILSGDSWMQIVVDGRTDYEGVLKRGDRRSWTARNEILIVAGNAGAVSLSANGGNAKTMGAPGSVEEVTVTPTTR